MKDNTVDLGYSLGIILVSQDTEDRTFNGFYPIYFTKSDVIKNLFYTDKFPIEEVYKDAKRLYPEVNFAEKSNTMYNYSKSVRWSYEVKSVVDLVKGGII